jgi:two-component system OmpR family sensor kinase
VSLRLRLLLLNTLIVLVVGGALGGAAYAVVVDSLERQLDEALREQARLYGANSGLMFDRGSRPSGVVLPNLQRFADANTFIQLTDMDGNVQARSRNLDQDSLPVPSQALLAAREGRDWRGDVAVDGTLLRQLVTPLRIAGTAEGQPTLLVIQVARPLAPMQQTLGTLQATGLSVGAAGILIALAAGWLLARAALGPIDVLARTAQAIGAARDFGRRVPRRDASRDEIGQLSGAFNHMLDELQSAHQQLEASLDSQRRFVADASHELRTPLGTVRGNIDLLRHMRGACAACDARQADILIDLSAETERMGRLVGDLLLLAQADAGQHLSLQPLDLGHVVQTVARSARALRVDVPVDVIGAWDDVWVRADPDRLHQVLLILLDNALKVTRSGGRVTLSCAADEDMVAVQVIDDGPGVPLNDRERIFQRFYRGRGTRSGEGTGLGLAIARWIVDEHNGRIEVADAPGRGAVFTLRLPACDAVQPDFSVRAA